MLATTRSLNLTIGLIPDQGLETIRTTLGTRLIEDQAGVIRTTIQGIILGVILVRAGVNKTITEAQDHQQEDRRQAEILLEDVQEDVDN